MSVSSPHPAENAASQPIPRPFCTQAGGRPRSLDDETKKLVCELLVKGMNFKEAAAYVACDPDTIRNERKRDPHFDFNVKRARAMANIVPLTVIRAAARTSWRAAAWLIDHRRRVKKEAAEARQARQQAEADAQEVAELEAAAPETASETTTARSPKKPRATLRRRRELTRDSFSASPREPHTSVLEAMLAVLEQRKAAQGLTLDQASLDPAHVLRSEPKNSLPQGDA